MARPDFYFVLGVRPEATPARIRAAFRDLAKRHHPDHEGGSTRRFQEISEAYRTLADPEARRVYDAEAAPGFEPARRRGAPPPEEATVEPLEVLDPAARYRPSFESLQERYLRNFDPRAGAPKGEVVEGLNVEVRLSVEEAYRGVVVPIEVPTLQACEACGGEGHVWLFPCAPCRRTGYRLVAETVRLRLAPPVVAGAVFELPLDHLGIHNFYLRVHTVVD